MTHIPELEDQIRKIAQYLGANENESVSEYGKLLHRAYQLGLEKAKGCVPPKSPRATTPAKETRILDGDVVLTKEMMQRAKDELNAEIEGYNACRAATLQALDSLIKNL